MALSKKQQAFVEYYLQCWNATKAATLAGYSAKTARQQGSRLLSNADIQAAIDARIEELKLGADEVLIRLGQQARGEQAEYIGLHERHDPDTGARWTEPEFDFERCQVEGKLHLIKGWSYDRTGRLQLDFYDAQAALVQLGKHHKLFNEGPVGVKVTPDGAVQIYIPDNGRG